LVLKVDQASIAQTFKVSKMTVSRLVKKFKSDPDFMDKLSQTWKETEELEEVVTDLVNIFKLEKKHIHSVDQI